MLAPQQCFILYLEGWKKCESSFFQGLISNIIKIHMNSFNYGPMQASAVLCTRMCCGCLHLAELAASTEEGSESGAECSCSPALGSA